MKKNMPHPSSFAATLCCSWSPSRRRPAAGCLIRLWLLRWGRPARRRRKQSLRRWVIVWKIITQINHGTCSDHPAIKFTYPSLFIKLSRYEVWPHSTQRYFYVLLFSLICWIRRTGKCGPPFWLWSGSMVSRWMRRKSGSFWLWRLCPGSALRTVIIIVIIT